MGEVNWERPPGGSESPFIKGVYENPDGQKFEIVLRSGETQHSGEMLDFASNLKVLIEVRPIESKQRPYAFGDVIWIGTQLQHVLSVWNLKPEPGFRGSIRDLLALTDQDPTQSSAAVVQFIRSQYESEPPVNVSAEFADRVNQGDLENLILPYLDRKGFFVGFPYPVQTSIEEVIHQKPNAVIIEISATDITTDLGANQPYVIYYVIDPDFRRDTNNLLGPHHYEAKGSNEAFARIAVTMIRGSGSMTLTLLDRNSMAPGLSTTVTDVANSVSVSDANWITNDEPQVGVSSKLYLPERQGANHDVIVSATVESSYEIAGGWAFGPDPR